MSLNSFAAAKQMSCYLFCGGVFAGRNEINVDGHLFICFAFTVLRLRLRIALTLTDTWKRGLILPLILIKVNIINLLFLVKLTMLTKYGKN